jgi:elongation factor G
MIEIAIEPKSRADKERLDIALVKLAAEDPAFAASIDHESGQVILKGMSELQLDTVLDALKQTYKVDARIGAPQVAFLETVTCAAEVEYAYKKQSGGTGQFAAVRLHVEPNDPGKGFDFACKIGRDVLPSEYIPGILKGIESVLGSGVVAGYPVVDIKVALVDGKYHDTDSSARAFETAARAAFREALQKGRSMLLEPIMKVEVQTPELYKRTITDDLNLRRAQLGDQEMRDHGVVIRALVPLMSMFGYENNLRAMSRGLASFSMQFDHYAPAPPPRDDDPTFRPAIGLRG